MCRNKSPILLAYFGGNFSEGADFKNEKARLVIIVGIPFIRKDKIFETK